MTAHPVVDHDTWLARRLELLEKEKTFTRARDELTRARQALPWRAVETAYEFRSETGLVTLPALFAGCSQLIVYHFMFGPDWDAGCPSCSFWADGFERQVVHLRHRDIQLAAVSRTAVEKIAAYRQRMGWTFPWVSSLGNGFNRDFNVSFTDAEIEGGQAFYNYRMGSFPSEEAPGISVFVKDAADRVFHTYSCFARGLDMMNPAYQYMDLVPRGRDEEGLDFTMAWLRRHDEY